VMLPLQNHRSQLPLQQKWVLLQQQQTVKDHGVPVDITNAPLK